MFELFFISLCPRSTVWLTYPSHRCADNVTRHDHFHAPVLLAAGIGVVGSHRVGLTKALGGNVARVYALLDQISSNRIRALLGKPQVERIAADAVGIAIQFQLQPRMC